MKKRPADLSIVKRLGGFLCGKYRSNNYDRQVFGREIAYERMKLNIYIPRLDNLLGALDKNPERD